MCECCAEETTVVCKFGTYRFEVMPFGLMNASATFQRLMDKFLEGADFVRIYVDDVVVFSESEEDHMEHLRIV